jgi:DNA polymerase-1
MAFQRLGQKVTADKEAGVVSCASEGYAIETADRWLAERASVTRELAAKLKPGFPRPALEKIYQEIERLTPVLARMEIHGVAIDVPLLNEMSARMEKDLRARAEDLGGGRRGIQHQLPVKLGQILFEKLGYPAGRKTAKTKASSTGVEVLSDLAAMGYPVPRLTLEYRRSRS